MGKSKKRLPLFVKWIDDTGIDALSRALKVNVFTIFHWRAGRVYPRVKYMKEIVRLSNGTISYADIIDRTTTRNTTRIVGK